jgi:glyoxylase-like metal-dependent hydrolase (beta-lactamase superfamily II)
VDAGTTNENDKANGPASDALRGGVKGDDLYLRRLQLGLMQNYVYLVGSRAKRECLVVDPAWNVGAALSAAEHDDMKVVGALATHWHPDHVGGDLFGHTIEGLPELLARQDVPVHVQRAEAAGIAKVTGIAPRHLVVHDGGDEIAIGDVKVKLLHTPGHTPGSQCFLCRGHLISGDTLFIRGCGRVDLPGGDSETMWRTLTGVLAKLPADTVLHPGHQYGPIDHSTIGDELRENPCLNVPRLEDWFGMMGR